MSVHGLVSLNTHSGTKMETSFLQNESKIEDSLRFFSGNTRVRKAMRLTCPLMIKLTPMVADPSFANESVIMNCY